MHLEIVSFFFFFQAEDGIRDLTVTGVQTCALPILIDLGVEQGIVRKAGAWYTYDGEQLGQGKENARTFLRDNPDAANEIEKKIKEKLGVGARIDADVTAPAEG